MAFFSDFFVNEMMLVNSSRDCYRRHLVASPLLVIFRAQGTLNEAPG